MRNNCVLIHEKRSAEGMLLSWQDLAISGVTVTSNETCGAFPTCSVVSWCWLCSLSVLGKFLGNQKLGMYHS